MLNYNFIWLVKYPELRNGDYTNVQNSVGWQINFQDANQQTLLHVAAECNLIALAEHLLSSCNFNINFADANGNTPLHIAAIGGHVEMVNWLIDHNVETENVNQENKRAIEIANQRNNFEIVFLLLPYLFNNLDDYVRYFTEQKINLVQWPQKEIDKLIPLINLNDTQATINQVITSLLYEHRRHAWNSFPCILRRNILKIHFRGQANYYDSADFYANYILAQERNTNSFYGSELSDDSDSEDEQALQNDLYKMHRIDDGRNYRSTSGNRKLQQELIKFLEATNPNFNVINQVFKKLEKNNNKRINIDSQEISDEVRNELELVNNIIKNGEFNKLQEIKTRFVVAQYRGVHYRTDAFSKPARLRHRKTNERGARQFSPAAYRGADIKISERYYSRRQSSSEIEQRLIESSNKIRATLSYARRVPLASNLYYSSLLDYLQEKYSEQYAAIPEHTRLFNQPLVNHNQHPLPEANPFISTGDIPQHALRYGYGSKDYVGRDGRLRPRWRESGRLEYSHMGKIYLSMHPITDYFQPDGPNHVSSMIRKGRIFLTNIISSEKETAFLGFLDENRVIDTFITKYPSFHRDNYKPIFLEKYGLDQKDYFLFKRLVAMTRPNTNERRQIKKLLGIWLCNFHEARLANISRRRAEELGAVLVYRQIDGTFNFIPPTEHAISNVQGGNVERDQVQNLRTQLAPYFISPASHEFNINTWTFEQWNLYLNSLLQNYPMIRNRLIDSYYSQDRMVSDYDHLFWKFLAKRFTWLQLFPEIKGENFTQFLFWDEISNITDKQSQTLLHIAARYGFLRIAEELINSGSTLDRQDKFGETPLHKAAHRNKQDVYQYLKDRGASDQIENSKKQTPSMLYSKILVENSKTETKPEEILNINKKEIIPDKLSIQSLSLSNNTPFLENNIQHNVTHSFPGYNLLSIAGDGNCMFNAIVDQLHRRKLSEQHCTHHELRQIAVDYIKDHPKAFMNSVTNEMISHFINDNARLEQFTMEERLDAYIRMMSRDHEYGDQLILTALGQHFNICINVMRSDTQQIRSEGMTELQGQREIFIGYSVDPIQPESWMNHYDSLIPLPSQNDTQAQATNSDDKPQSDKSSHQSETNPLENITPQPAAVEAPNPTVEPTSVNSNSTQTSESAPQANADELSKDMNELKLEQPETKQKPEQQEVEQTKTEMTALMGNRLTFFPTSPKNVSESPQPDSSIPRATPK